MRKNVEFGRKGGAALLERFGLATLADAKPRELSAASASGSRWRGRSRPIRRCCCSTSRSPPSTLTPAERSWTELQQLLREADRPTLVVTHDFEDAATLATQVGVLVQGRLRQLGTPAELVASPADPFVASLTGANVLRGAPAARRI